MSGRGEALVAVGDAITEHRLKRYRNALVGRSEHKSADRHLFRHDVDSFCRVVVSLDENGKKLYRGNCPDFSKRHCCVHAAYLKHGEEVSLGSFAIPEFPNTRLRHGDSSVKEQLFRRLETIHAIRLQVLNVLLDEGHAVPITEKIRTGVLDLPDSHVWGLSAQHRNVKMLYATKLTTANKTHKHFVDLFNSICKFRAKKAEEHQVLGFIEQVHNCLELITNGRNTHAPERPRRDPLSPELLRR